MKNTLALCGAEGSRACPDCGSGVGAEAAADSVWLSGVIGTGWMSAAWGSPPLPGINQA